jgi:hypothetical protein
MKKTIFFLLFLIIKINTWGPLQHYTFGCSINNIDIDPRVIKNNKISVFQKVKKQIKIQRENYIHSP